MQTPNISDARVIAVDPDHRRLTVTLPSTQVVSVRMAYPGPADGLRVSHKAMPGRGTEGIVVFPGGDNRNGFWLASVYVQAMDALTTNTDPFLEYESHWSGHWEMLDGEGNCTTSFADGSFVVAGSGMVQPATFRHTIDESQHRQLTPFSQSERVPTPPSPFNLVVSHISGTTTSIDPSGNMTVSGASGATLMLAFNGATNSIDGSGNLTINSPKVNVVSPDVQIGSQGETLHTLLTSVAAAAYNSHEHTNNGASPPTVLMTAADETSVLTAG